MTNNLTPDPEVLAASGVRIYKCLPANCAGGSTNSITRRELTRERRQFAKMSSLCEQAELERGGLR